jgi:serine/threonine-protein kinase HipA
MSVNGKFKNISADDVLTVANRYGVGEARQLIKTVRESIQAWPDFAKKAGLNENEVNRIRKLLISW